MEAIREPVQTLRRLAAAGADISVAIVWVLDGNLVGERYASLRSAAAWLRRYYDEGLAQTVEMVGGDRFQVVVIDNQDIVYTALFLRSW